MDEGCDAVRMAGLDCWPECGGVVGVREDVDVEIDGAGVG